MNIVVVCSYFGPETSVGVNRVNALVRHWLALGHSIDVVTMPYGGGLPAPLQNQSRLTIHQVRPWFSRKKISESAPQSYAGAPNRLNGLVKKTFYFIKKHVFANYLDLRVLWWPKAAKAITRLAETKSIDMMFTCVPSYTAHSVGAFVKWKHPDIFWVADYRDLWSGNPIFPGFILVRWLEQRHEQFIIRNADLLVTINEDLAQHLKQLHGPKKILVVPNGFEAEDFDFVTSEEHSSAGKNIVYTGTVLSGLQNPQPLFLAVCNLLRNGKLEVGDLKINFYGNAGAIIDTAEFRLLIDNGMVVLHGSVARKHSLQMQRSADLLLFLGSRPVKNSLGTVGVVSGKIFEYFNSNTEIMALGVSRDMIVAQMIQDAEVGDVYAEDISKIEQRLVTLVQQGKQSITPNQTYLNQFRRKEQAVYLITEIQRQMQLLVKGEYN